MAFSVGVDVGGTFTDVFVLDDAGGQPLMAKVPSTPEDPSIAVINGIDKVCSEHAIDPTEIRAVMHGTTVATNAVLTGNGARVGLIVTDGYRQILHLARGFVPGALSGWINFVKGRPMAELRDTVEVSGRIGADGAEVRPLDEAQVRAAVEKLRTKDIQSVTICLMNSYVNSAHEEAVEAIVRELMPGVAISVSSRTLPEVQEYERAITSVANAFVKPVVSRYLTNLKAGLEDRTGSLSLSILRSDGGLAAAQTAAEYPVNLLMSGPAGGVAGAIWVARQSGFENIITFDMGGTSTDVCLVEGGEAQVRRETVVHDVIVRASSVDVRTVGAGGGSIAYVPELTKALRVGPESAGAVPGPAAYDKGGENPTVTDANVVLGYLPSDARLGGDMKIRKDLAAKALEKVSEPLGMTLAEAAEGVIRIVNENMFGALRLVSVEQGYDPRNFSLMAFGGAGPLHANALGRLLGAWPVIVPRGPGVLCAAGDATTNLRDEAARSLIKLADETTQEELVDAFAELEQRARASLDADGVARDRQEVRYQVDLRYAGQSADISVTMSPEDFLAEGLAPATGRFDELHEQMFNFRLSKAKEIVNLRVIVLGPGAEAVELHVDEGDGDASRAAVAATKIYSDGETHDGTIYDRSKLLAGDRIDGPAIITEVDSTTLVLPGSHAMVDSVGNLLIRDNS
ncbi:hydantoinase/oxoprolinase family protein [Pseudohaliea rubra]|uniref:N-methylhydantoinase A n=1 Tax=Pseudohaliea rubra DSM 19751 TaxID=1265313 RepID=A0A095VSU0_9GAMM|nr:hydantoinase/oxoprolinase family protein [Pseudohaliea rubra]KGE04522.1 N-methylhydantoinase A [Pseudohaliea rubra DSM 19751]